MRVGARVGRDWSLRKCDTIVERPARCRSSSELDLPRGGRWIPDRFLIISGRGVNDRTDLVHGVDGQTSEACVFADGLGVIGDVDAEDLVVGDVALLPLHPR